MRPTGPPTACRQGVEEPHFGRPGGREPRQPGLERAGVQVVEQEPHPHAARRGALELEQEAAAGGVVADQVDLHVDRPLGGADEGDPRAQRLRAVDEPAEAGPAASVGGRGAAGERRQGRGADVRRRHGHARRRRRRQAWQRRTAAERDGDDEHRHPPGGHEQRRTAGEDADRRRGDGGAEGAEAADGPAPQRRERNGLVDGALSSVAEEDGGEHREQRGREGHQHEGGAGDIVEEAVHGGAPVRTAHRATPRSSLGRSPVATECETRRAPVTSITRDL